MDFKNKHLAKRFKINSEFDSVIKVPGYHGKLSEVTDAKILETLISQKSNLVSKLPTAKEAKAADNNETPEEPKTDTAP